MGRLVHTNYSGLVIARCALLLVLAFGLSGCGGSSAAPLITVTISPTVATVQVGQTLQFSATVQNTTNTAVTWEVNGASGGNTTIGTISGTGLYAAPSAVPSAQTVTITAVSQADSSRTASTNVIITGAPTISVTVAPTSATVAAATSVQFSAAVSNSTNLSVTWQVNGVAGGNATFGTITATGLYTAPVAPPLEAISVTAVSQADATKTGSASVTITFAPASLNGTYVFAANHGGLGAGTAAAFIAGTFQADGKGNLTSGVEDVNAAGTLSSSLTFTGSYTVGADGRGSATLTGSDGSKRQFFFALISGNRGRLVEYDNSATPSGFIQRQDPAAIASASGTFVFRLLGSDGAGPLGAAGLMQLSSGNITGVEDVNDKGVVSANLALSGTYTVGAGGRITAKLTTALGTANFVFYIADATTLALVSTDTSGPRASGMAIAQSVSSFTNASLGSSAFFLRGNTVSGVAAYSAAARFDTDGAGNLTGGTLDQNPSPTNPGFTVSNLAFKGTYAVAGNGRGSATIGTPNGPVSLIFWMASATQAFLLEADASAVASGVLLAQQSGLSTATWSGNYVFELSGGAGSQATSASGVLKADGKGGLTGTEDQVLGGTPTSGVALSGTYSVANGGRGTGTISAPAAASYVFYILNSRQSILLTGDLSQSSAGLAETQCSDCN